MERLLRNLALWAAGKARWVLKSIRYSCRGPRFSPQHLHGNSQLHVASVLRCLTRPLASEGIMHSGSVHTYVQTDTHKIEVKSLKKSSCSWSS